MRDKIFENLQFVVLACLIVGQCVVGEVFWIGQTLYLIANITSSTRCFVLHRPLADKIKEVSMLCVTIGIMLIRFFN